MKCELLKILKIQQVLKPQLVQLLRNSNWIHHLYFQLISNLYLSWNVSILLETLNTIEVLFEVEYPLIIKYAYDFNIIFNTILSFLTWIETWMIKFWLKFVRKKMVVMDESFICVALTSINIMLCSLWSMTKVFLGNSTISHPFAEHATTINYFMQKEDV